LEKVLVAVDGYEASLGAVKKAVELASRYGAEVIAVQVEEEIPLLPAEKETELAARMKEQHFFAKPLELAAAYGQKYGLTVRQIKAQGVISATILKIANDLQVDLVVIGDSGRKGLGKMHFGSVSESISRSSAIPVLIVKKGSVDLSGLDSLMSGVGAGAATEATPKTAAPPAALEPSALGQRFRFSFGLLGVFALIYFIVALLTSAQFKELAQLQTIGLPLGIWLGLAVFVGGLVITRIYLAKGWE